MASQTYTHNLAKLVASGKVTEAQIDEAVLPIPEVKYELGLFDHPYVDESKIDATLSRREGPMLARRVAGESMVLLKNDNHTLPLGKNLKKVAVIGMLADSIRDIQGCCTVDGLLGAGKGHTVTVLEGLKDRLGENVQVTYVAGPPPTREFASQFEDVPKPQPPPAPEEVADWEAKVKVAGANADVVIAVLGELASMSSETASRATLDLPGI